MSEKRCYTVKELQAILGVSRPGVLEEYGIYRMPSVCVGWL